METGQAFPVCMFLDGGRAGVSGSGTRRWQSLPYVSLLWKLLLLVCVCGGGADRTGGPNRL